MEDKVLFDDDQKKIEDSVMNYPMGSYQAGEVVRLSALLYSKGINVENELKKLHNKFASMEMECYQCDGKGVCLDWGDMKFWECDVCNGTGEVDE